MPNSNCTASSVQFSRQGRQTIEVNFQGGELTSDGGMLLLQRFDKRIGLTQAAGAVLSDTRCAERVMHTKPEMLAQRVYVICCGYEDLNDHSTLRNESPLQNSFLPKSAEFKRSKIKSLT